MWEVTQAHLIQNLCAWKETLDSKVVLGKIVISDRGLNPRVQKSNVVKGARGVEMILTNFEANGQEIYIMLRSNKISCTFWGVYAENLNNQIEQHQSTTPPILIVQQCRLRKYLGSMGISNCFLELKCFSTQNYLKLMNTD